MAVVRNIITRVGADINPLQKNMAKAQTTVDKFQKNVTKGSSAFGKSVSSMVAGANMGLGSMISNLSLGKLGYIALAATAARAFADIAKSSINAAMQAVESENLFEVSMGNMANSARDWSNQLQESLGLNGYQVRANVGMFYNMTTSMGLARKSAYKLSTDITKLAYDMASFYNTSNEEMFTKLSSGITGEAEPLRRIGVIVTENALQQQAYAMGIKKSVQAMSEQEKVMLRYNAIMAQTKNAQGDLARTINSPANQMRLFQTQIELAAINLGNAFMPLVQQVLPLLVNFAKGLVMITNTLAQFSQALFGSNSAQAQNASSAADAASAQTNLGDSIKGAGAKAKKALASFDQLNTLQEGMAASATDAADAMSTAPTPAKPDNINGISQGILDTANKIKEALKPAIDAIENLKKTISDFVKNVGPDLQTIAGFLKPILSTAAQIAADAINSLAKAISDLISGDLKFIGSIIKTVASILKGDWKGAWDGAKSSVEGLKGVLNGAYQVFQWITNPLGQVIKLIWEHTGAGEKLKELWKWINDKAPWVKTAFSLLINPIGTITSKISEHLGIGDKLKTMWAWVRDNAGPIFNGAKGIICFAFDAVGKTVTNVWNGIKDTIKNSINSVIETINGFIRRINKIKITIPAVDIPHIGKVGGASIGLPQVPEIPKLAQGGIITKPTLAQVGEGYKKEAIVPLENTSFVDKMASAVGSAVLSALGGMSKNNSSSTAILKVGETEFGRLCIRAINNVQRQAGETLLEV